MITVYRDDDNSRTTVRQLMALPFVPVDQVEYVFEKISESESEKMAPLIDYFENFWMKKMRWSLWNVYGVQQRTNNIVEGECFSFSF